jgi:PAS domain S-box-containing protein
MALLGSGVSPSVNRPVDIQHIVGEAWPLLLDNVDVAMLVMDRDRRLRYVNDRARALLGVDSGAALGQRCRLMTRGLDCSDACPLTYAIDRGLQIVEDFAAVYQRADGRPVSVRVTVLPLRDHNGDLTGHVEILRSSEPDPGFYLAGESSRARRLRRRVVELAASDAPLWLVGEAVATADVAAAVHRFSGLEDGLFHTWEGEHLELPPWPPGTLHVPDGVEIVEDAVPDGWRLMVSAGRPAPTGSSPATEVLELPGLEHRQDDLPMMVRAWAAQMRRGVAVHPEALQRLVRMAVEIGLDELGPVLRTAVAAADDMVLCSHLPNNCYSVELVDELLRSERPLAALEERLLREVLERSGWRMQEAADRLGVSRVTLWRKLKDHGIEKS